MPLLNSSVLWKHSVGIGRCRAGVEGGQGAVLDAPNRAHKEEQDPSLGHSIRSRSKTRMEGSSQRSMEFQSRRNGSAATEEFYLQGKEGTG